MVKDGNCDVCMANCWRDKYGFERCTICRIQYGDPREQLMEPRW